MQSETAAPRSQQDIDALRQNEERFRNVFVQASLPQVLGDLDLNLVAANSLYCDLLGYTEDQLITLRAEDVTHPDDRERQAALIDALVAGERESVTVEKRYVRPDRTLRYVRNHVRLVRDDSGHPRFLHALVEDITDQREVERALAASEARLRALFQHSRDVVLLVDSQGAVRSASPNCERVAPVLTEPGASVFDPLEAAEATRLRAALSAVVLRGEDARLQITDAAEHGRRVWDVLLENRLEDPALGAVVARLRDITRQVTYDALAEGEAAVLRMLLTGTPRDQVLQAVATMVESTWPELRATVLLVAPDGRTLRHGAAPSMPAEFIEAVDGLPIADSGGGVCGRAAARDTPVIVEDVRADPVVGDYAPLLASIAVRSLWSLPLHDGEGKVVGTFALYGDKATRPTAGQWQLVQHLAHLASLVIAGQTTAAPLGGPSRRLRRQSVVDRLTHRERHILRLVALGHTNYEIAERLQVSVRTVESHRAAVATKVGAQNRADLVRVAVEAGMLCDAAH